MTSIKGKYDQTFFGNLPEDVLCQTFKYLCTPTDDIFSFSLTSKKMFEMTNFSIGGKLAPIRNLRFTENDKINIHAITYRLKRLDFTGSEINDEKLMKITNNKGLKLEAVSFNYCQLAPETIYKFLSSQASITYIGLTRCHITSEVNSNYL